MPKMKTLTINNVTYEVVDQTARDNANSNGVFIANYGTTTWAEIKAAYDAGKFCIAKNSNGMVATLSNYLTDYGLNIFIFTNASGQYANRWTIAENSAVVWQSSTYMIEEIFIATYGTTTLGEIQEAWNAGKMVFCKRDSIIYSLYSFSGVHAQFYTTLVQDISVIPGLDTGVTIEWVYCNSSNKWDTMTADVLSLSGGYMNGPLTLSGDPTEALHAATKQYVDNAIADAIAAAMK